MKASAPISGTSRPPLPPQEISKWKPSFQFPKSLCLPFLRPIVNMMDRGTIRATNLKRHIVICGFPRSGSTLLQMMVETAVRDMRTFGRERRGMDKARHAFRTHPYMMTKRPSDIFCVQDLRDFYAPRDSEVRFVLMIRDPRAVLTSVHQANKPGEYYVPVERWRAIHTHLKWAEQFDDTILVRFEDLVRDPLRVQERLTGFIGWELKRSFEDYYSSSPDRFDARALNGKRRLDSSTIDRWQMPEHRQRIIELLSQDMVDLPERLIEMKYETDDSWTLAYDPTAATSDLTGTTDVDTASHFRAR